MRLALHVLHPRAASAALAAALALAACRPSLELPAGADVSCRSTADCPTGRVCQLDRCQDPSNLDTTPPDLVGAVTVDPPRGRAGTTFTVRLEATEALATEPRVSLGLAPPVDLACASGGGNAYLCSYTASGGENGGSGGTAGLDVRLRDRAGNETVRGNVGVLVLDFAPPGVAVASVSYLPSPTNPLPFVSRATVGTRARVAVSSDERLSTTATPTLTAPAAPALAFALVPGSLGDTGAVFEATVPAGLADGTYSLRVGWQDEVGNAGTADLPAAASAVVRTSAPVLQVDQAKLVFVRSPQGNAASEALGGHTLPAGPYFAVEPDDTLSGAATLPAGSLLLGDGATPTRLVVQSSGGSSPLVLGALSPDAGGLFPRQQLVSPDLPEAWLVGVDDAGNRSAPVRLQQAEWVATSNRPLLGSPPHDVTSAPAAWPVRAPPQSATLAQGTEDGGADRSALLARAALAWAERESVGGATPPNRGSHAIAYDAARGRLVLYAGYASAQDRDLADTWEWDGQAWEDVTPKSGGPGDRSGHAMAYDAARGRVVLFGGNSQQTWEWDGTAWHDVTPAGPSPSARWLPGMAYDAARGRLVLFGGLPVSGGAFLQDTWEWDGAAWANVTPAPPGPPGRYGQGMAHDPQRGRTVIFGGYGDLVALQDTWEWNGSTWQDVTPAGVKPSARGETAMAHDPVRQRTVLFGGGANLADTWEWDGTAWQQMTPASASPLGRHLHAMAYDPARGAVLLFAGNIGGSSDRGDTQAWDGTAWTDLTPSGTWPHWRADHGMAWQTVRRSVVMFGGQYFPPGGINIVRLSDTWEWDGTNWRDRTPAGGPSARYGFGFAYDSARGRAVLFGGSPTTSAETWEWDGVAWANVTPAAGSPSARFMTAMAYDAARSRTVLFGGLAGGAPQGDTFTWNGTGWASAAGGPPARSDHAMVFDPGRARVVMFGGSGASGLLGDTWEWNGSAWAQVATTGPSPRSGHAMTYDSARGRVLLLGGPGGAGPADVWEWNGTTWRDVTPPGALPEAREGHRAAFDPVRGRAVVFGSNAVLPASVWGLDCTTSRTPAVQLDVDASAAGFTPAQVARVTVRAFAGGTSGTGVPGAALLGWSGSPSGQPPGWTALGANGVAPAASAPYLPAPPASLVAWTSASAPEARRVITERDARLAFQVRPLGPAGASADAAAVALDYFEVRVRYAAGP
jgi:hypothetical protein